ncbi:hypothetical protein Taro_026101, partial [Colocasia esculenta]|nr:hypothetical protein [Colocasia esculenta]
MASWGSAAVRLGVGKSGGAALSSETSATANDAAAGVSILAGMTRIYMGGLGGGVTEADIVKTFAPLGRVRRVDFVRTKGRAFAYIDFEPNSDKSLAKLFATYNGCIWKGGRLRLEKAKEHYLIRLKRECAEDAEPSKKPDVADMGKCFISSDKPKQMAEEKMQLRIFFPKLRKVKALPFKGTGKHKYSFQRIAIPSLPVHFCDCEEHCHSHEDPNQDQPKYVKDQTVVKEKELSIMSSVMKKLFEKEANTNVADSTAFQATEREILDDSKNETQFGDGDAAQQSDSDVDNFVTNIGLGNKEDVLSLMQLKGWDSATLDREGQNKSLFCPEELGGGLWLLTQCQRHGRWTPSIISASSDLAVDAGLCRTQTRALKIG